MGKGGVDFVRAYVYRDDMYLYGVEIRNDPSDTEIPDELYRRYLANRKEADEIQEELSRYSSEG